MSATSIEPVPVEVLGTTAKPPASTTGTWRRAEGEVATFHLGKAFAPGAPLTIHATFGGVAITVMAKAVGSKKDGEGFEVKARLITPTRAARQHIVDHFSPKP
jgi:hypothetical protein